MFLIGCQFLGCICFQPLKRNPRFTLCRRSLPSFQLSLKLISLQQARNRQRAPRERAQLARTEKAAIKKKITLTGKCLLQFPQILGKKKKTPRCCSSQACLGAFRTRTLMVCTLVLQRWLLLLATCRGQRGWASWSSSWVKPHLDRDLFSLITD